MRPLRQHLLFPASCALALVFPVISLAQIPDGAAEAVTAAGASTNVAAKPQSLNSGDFPESPGALQSKALEAEFYRTAGVYSLGQQSENSPQNQQNQTTQQSQSSAAQISAIQPTQTTGTPTQPQHPVGTAAAEAPKVTGITAAEPAGVAMAPAKQRRVRTIVLKVGAIIGAGVALGMVVALTAATPSKPPGAH